MSDLINIMIVDNEEACVNALLKDLKHYPQMNVIETFNSPVKAITRIIQEQPDVLFLDVALTVRNGFEVLKELRSSMRTDRCVMIYSACDQYRLAAI